MAPRAKRSSDSAQPSSHRNTRPLTNPGPAFSGPPSPARRKIKFNRLSTEQGLSQTVVTCIVQDRTGFMWFGTWGGLNRYDGYNFVIYRPDLEAPQNLSSKSLRAMCQDQKGALWIGTDNGGLNRFDPETERFQHYYHDPLDPYSLSNDHIFSLHEDRQGHLWIGTWGGGLNRFDPETKRFYHYQHDPSQPDGLNNNRVRAIYEDRQGLLWIGTYGGGLNCFNPNTCVFHHYQHNPANPHSLNNNHIFAIYEDHEEVLWVGTYGGGLNRFDRQTEQFHAYQHDPTNPGSLSNDQVMVITEDQAGQLWVGTFGGGLNRFERGTGQFSRYQHDPADPYSLGNNRVRAIYEDQAGVFWVGTENGLSHFSRATEQFSYYHHDPADPHSLSNNYIYCIHHDQGNISWIGTENGLNRFDGETEQFRHYYHDPANPHSLSHNLIWSIHQDRVGRLWIGTESGLNHFDQRTEQFQRYRHDPANPHSLSNDHIFSIYEDRRGYLWIGTWGGGLNRFDPETGQFRHYLHDPANPHSLNNNHIFFVYEDRAGLFWVGTEDGLSWFDPQTELFNRYLHDPANPQSLSNNRVYVIYEDRAGRLWIGTDGGGLNWFDRNRQIFKRYLKKDGLPNSTVSGIIEDNQGHLWLNTHHGISKFNPELETFKNYDASHGLQGDAFFWGCAKNSRGELLVGGNNGLNHFDPTRLKSNPIAPPIVLTQFLIFNQPVAIGSDYSPLQKAIWATPAITLSPEDYIFSFEFAALSYAAPQKNRYKYKMEGFEQEWNEVDSQRRFATYTNLPAGDYVFRVIGSNYDGVWNEEGVQLNLTVQPPWWEKLKTEKEAAELARRAAEAANEAKSAFLANMSHELRTPLNAVLGFAQLILQNPELSGEDQQHLKIIHRSGEHLLTLINNILDLSKIEAGQTTWHKKSFDLYHLLNDLEVIFRLRADEKQLQLMFEWGEDVPQYIQTDETKLRQVLINLLSNALKFTGEGGVSVEVSRAGEGGPATLLESGALGSPVRLLFVVGDSGPGIAPDELDKLFKPFVQTESGRHLQEGTGLGLSISRHFVQLMGGELTVRSRLGRGTIFSFDIQVDAVDTAEVEPAPLTRQVVALEAGQPVYRILVVDDKVDNRMLLVKLLSPLGFELQEAGHGQEAIDIWNRFEPHLIWLDMRMPILNGYETAKRIKAAEQGQKTIIIGLTASSFEEEREVVLAAGCDDFLRKPFRERDILELMGKHLGVRYVYEGGPPRTSISARSSKFEELRRKIAPLPPEWIANLERAALELDMEMVNSLIEQVHPLEPALADHLGALASQFKYEAILKLVRG